MCGVCQGLTSKNIGPTKKHGYLSVILLWWWQSFFILRNLEYHINFVYTFVTETWLCIPYRVLEGYHLACSPVKIWEDPPQIATKTKWPPFCRKFCVDFKNEKFTKINRVEPFQISHYILGPWEKLLKHIAIYIFFTIMKNISLFTTNMVYIYFHTQYKIMWMAGWLITKLFEGLHTEICKIKEKYFFISSQCFPHNFVNIQQIWLVDGLNCFNRTNACYE